MTPCQFVRKYSLGWILRHPKTAFRVWVAFLGLLAIGCGKPTYQSGTLQVLQNLDTGPVEVAAEFWNGHGGDWAVSRQCVQDPCIPVYVASSCQDPKAVACYQYDEPWGDNPRILVTPWALTLGPELLIAHEIGHMMGHEHQEGTIMASRAGAVTWDAP